MLQTESIPAVQSGSRSLMVVLHGLGDSSAGFRWLPATLALPWMNYLLVNAPDTYYVGFSWYDFTGDMIAGIRRSRGLIFELLDAQREKGFASEETTLFGFSQGCLMTIDAGFRYPHRLAGLVGISGYVSEPEELLTELSPVAARQRLLMTHGFEDPVIPFAIASEHVKVLKRAALQVSWHELVKGHTIEGEAELALIRDFVAAGYPKAAASK